MELTPLEDTPQIRQKYGLEEQPIDRFVKVTFHMNGAEVIGPLLHATHDYGAINNEPVRSLQQDYATADKITIIAGGVNNGVRGHLARTGQFWQNIINNPLRDPALAIFDDPTTLKNKFQIGVIKTKEDVQLAGPETKVEARDCCMDILDYLNCYGQPFNRSRENKVDTKQKLYRGLPVRSVGLPRSNTAFLGLMNVAGRYKEDEDLEAIPMLKEGDTLKLFTRGLQTDDEALTARVLPHNSRGSPNDVGLLMLRHRNKDGTRIEDDQGFPEPQQSLADLTATTRHEADEQLRVVEPQAVDFRKQESTEVERKLIGIFGHIQDKKHPHVTKLMLGTGYNSMADIDLYSGIPDSFMRQVWSHIESAKTKAHLESFTNMKLIQLIDSMGGTGKSELAMQAALPLVMSGKRALVVTPTNFTANALSKRYDAGIKKLEHLWDESKGPLPKVIRAYAMPSERKLLLLEAKREQREALGEEPMAARFDTDAMYEACEPGSIGEFFVDSIEDFVDTEQPVRGVRDKRIKHRELSTAAHALKVAGLDLDDEQYADPNPDTHELFRNFYGEMSDGQVLENEDKGTFSVTQNKLLEATYHGAGVVFCTAAGLVEHSLQTVMPYFDLVIVEEGGALPEHMMWPVLADTVSKLALSYLRFAAYLIRMR